MQPYTIRMDYAPNGHAGPCAEKACIFPGRNFRFYDQWRGEEFERCICLLHFIKGSIPFSMEYEDADALLGVPRHKQNGGCIGGGCKRRGLKIDRDAMLFGGAYARANWTTARRACIGNYAPRTQIFRFNRTERAYLDPGPQVSISDSPQQAVLTHWLDPIYNVFDKQKDLFYIYTLCGEKVLRTLVPKTGEEPTCLSCKRIALYERVLKYRQERPAPKPVLLTPPKPKPIKPEFEDLLLDGLLEQTAFESRRNWGERSGRVWNDPSQGVQRDSRLRWDRGGVNRKRG